MGVQSTWTFPPTVVSVSLRIWIWGLLRLAWKSNWESQDFSGKREEDSVVTKERQSGIVCFLITRSLVWMYPSFSKMVVAVSQGPRSLLTSSFCCFSFSKPFSYLESLRLPSSLRAVIWRGYFSSRRCEFRAAGLQFRIPAVYWRPKPLNQIHKKVSVLSWLLGSAFLHNCPLQWFQNK